MKTPKGKPRELAPEGTHPAVCVQIIDFGTQASNNPTFSPARKIQLGFELIGKGLKTEEGNAFVVYKEFTFSSSKKANWTKTLKAWLNVKDFDNFDVDTALSKDALITVSHRTSKDGDTTYNDITSIIARPKGGPALKNTEPLKSLYLVEGEFDHAEFKTLPQWMQDKIAKSPEYSEVMQGVMQAEKGGAAKGKKKKAA